jgi:hypothetical protein
MIEYHPLPQQRLITQHILNNPEAAIFAGMGLGKTAATIDAIATLIADGDVNSVLIVAPLRVALLTWPGEVGRYKNFDWLRVADLRCWEGRQAWVHKAAHIYVINYEQLPALCDDDWGFSLNIRGVEHLPNMIVWDELSKAKSSSSKRIKKFLPFRQIFKRHVGLTGTPVPNSYLELHPQIRLLDGGKRLGWSHTAFRNRYFESDYMGYKWNLQEGAKDKIEAKIADMAISLQVEEYLNLPPIEFVDEEVKLPADVFKNYRKLEKELLIQIANKEIIALTAAALVTKLLQFTSGAIYDSEKEVAQVHNEKTKALKEIVKFSQGGVLVAYHYKHERERILREVPGAVEFSEAAMADWNAGKIKVLIGHPQSIGHGLNLQHGGNTIVWYSLTYSRELFDQFNARLWRTGQTKNVTVYRLTVPFTVDEAVAEALRVKGDQQSLLLAAIHNINTLHKKLKAS